MSAPLDSAFRPVHCIVKLGGAAITLKDEFETLNDVILSVTAKQLRDAAGLSSAKDLSMDWSQRHATQESVDPDDYPRDASLDMKAFVVVHGAGSFGHFQASRATVNNGRLGTPFVKAGFVATRISTYGRRSVLHFPMPDGHIWLMAEGIPAVSTSPFSAGWSTIDKNLKLTDAAYLEQIINAGFLPMKSGLPDLRSSFHVIETLLYFLVLHGDAVLDSGQGCAILSGDVIVSQLAEVLIPSYVVFLTNVPGVFDRPPSDPHAILLKEIAVENGKWVIVNPSSQAGSKVAHAKHLLESVETNVSEHDTTGGMAKKIAEAASIAAKGVSVLIVQAGSCHALEALKGTPISNRANWIGTIIRKARPGEIASEMSVT